MVSFSKFMVAAVGVASVLATEMPAELNEGVETGHNLFEGDILTNFEQVASIYGSNVATAAKTDGLLEEDEGRRLGAPATRQALWTNGILYYTNSGVSQQLLNTAFSNLNAATGIRFVQRGSSNRNYVSVQKQNGCYSNVGMTGGSQVLSIGDGCTRIGTVMHEFMHALGMFHEQSNSNRDDYVQILSQNIQSGRQNNFAKASSDDLGILYDFGSVMHYPATAFSSNGQKTIRAIFGSTAAENAQYESQMGQRTRLSTTDAIQLQLMYHCQIQGVNKGVRTIFDLCTPDCPCAEGQGDCDTDADCQGNLVCSQTDGPGTYNYRGQSITIDSLDTCQRSNTGGGGGQETPSPTSPNGGSTCRDKDPSGLQYTTGAPAPCSEIGRFCTSDSRVPAACPLTCGVCQAGDYWEFPQYESRGVETEILDVAGPETSDVAGVSSTVFAGGLVGAAVGGAALMAIGVAVARRKNNNDDFEDFKVTQPKV